MAQDTYDYVIVGGGLSGCVLASRLKQYDQATRIVLIEAGQDTRDRPDVQQPQTLNLGGDLDWNYQTEPIPALANRAIAFNAGKGLGGGSAINSGMPDTLKPISRPTSVHHANVYTVVT